MFARLLRLVLVLFTIAAAFVSLGVTSSGSSLAGGVCNAGTHWDNYHSACR